MTCPVSWMSWASLGISYRQQVRTKLAEYLRDGARVQDVWVDGVGRGVCQMVVDPAAEFLGPEPPMHVPLLVPHRFQGRLGHTCQHGCIVGIAESSKSDLSARLDVRIPRIKSRSNATYDQQGVEIRLEQNINMDPLAQVASISYIAPNRIELIRLARAAILDVQPVAISGHIIDAGRRCLHLPVDPLGAKGSVQPHELGDVRTGERAWESAAKQGAGRNLSAGLGTAKVGESREVGRRLAGDRSAVVLRKRDVASQRHPIVLSH